MSVIAASCLSSRRSEEVPHVSVVILASTFKGKICLSVVNPVQCQAVFQELQSSWRARSVKLLHKGISQGY